jgi:hypothetical protein
LKRIVNEREEKIGSCAIEWADFALFTFSTSVPLKFVVSLSKARKMKKILF